MISNKRKGFTLAEIIVTLLIMGIVIAIASGFLIFGGNFLSATEKSAMNKDLAESSADFIKGRLLHAKSVDIVTPSAVLPAPSAEKDFLFIGEDANGDGVPEKISNTGRLYYMKAGNAAVVDVLGEERYKGCALALEYKAFADDASVVRVSEGEGSHPSPQKSFFIKTIAVRDGKQSYYVEKSFDFYNIKLDHPPTKNQEIKSWGDGAAYFYFEITPGT